MLYDYYYEEGIVPPDIHFRAPRWLKSSKPSSDKDEEDDTVENTTINALAVAAAKPVVLVSSQQNSNQSQEKTKEASNQKPTKLSAMFVNEVKANTESTLYQQTRSSSKLARMFRSSSEKSFMKYADSSIAPEGMIIIFVTLLRTS